MNWTLNKIFRVNSLVKLKQIIDFLINGTQAGEPKTCFYASGHKKLEQAFHRIIWKIFHEIFNEFKIIKLKYIK